MDKILKDYLDLKKGKDIEITAKKNIKNKKIIWQFWAQGWQFENLPDIVKLCYLSVERYKGDHIVIRLDENTMYDYLDFP